MAMRRVFKFFFTLVVLSFVVTLLVVIGAWVLVMRGPAIADNSTLILRIGGEPLQAEGEGDARLQQE